VSATIPGGGANKGGTVLEGEVGIAVSSREWDLDGSGKPK